MPLELYRKHSNVKCDGYGCARFYIHINDFSLFACGRWRRVYRPIVGLAPSSRIFQIPGNRTPECFMQNSNGNNVRSLLLSFQITISKKQKNTFRSFSKYHPVIAIDFLKNPKVSTKDLCCYQFYLSISINLPVVMSTIVFRNTNASTIDHKMLRRTVPLT